MSFRAPDSLVIGYGNPLRSDDAVGLHVARELQADGYRVIETYQLTPELAEDISKLARVIFVDCQIGLPPGEVVVRQIGRSVHADSHVQEPADLLRLAKEVYGAEPEAWLTGIGPETLDFGETLSPPAARAVPRAVEAIKKLLSDGAG